MFAGTVFGQPPSSRSVMMERQLREAIDTSLRQVAGSSASELTSLDYMEQLRLATERSKREEHARQLKQREDEEEMIRKAIAQSLDPKVQEETQQEAYRQQFATTLKASTERVNVEGKRSKKSAPMPPLSSTTDPPEFTRIQMMQKEEEDVKEALKRSIIDVTAEPNPSSSPPSVALSEEQQLRLALALSKADAELPPDRLCLTPPALQQAPIRLIPPYAQVASKPCNFKLQSRISVDKPPSVASSGSSCSADSKRKKGTRRPIVVDGCNVAYQHSKNKYFSAEGIKIVYDHFKRIGWQDNEIVVIAKRCFMDDASDAIVKNLESIGVFNWTPARYVGRAKIVCDDDDMVLNYALSSGGIIVSMDQYRKEYDKHVEFREVIAKRLLPFNFINNEIIFPRRPLGENGPRLDQFLRF